MRTSWILACLLLASPFALGQGGEGKELYDKYCAQCHGLSGDGMGYATWRVKPQPRDFTSGKYKFRSTPNGMMPTDADVVRVIKEGLPYTSMPGWPMFSDSQIREIVAHLKTFSADWENPDKQAQPISIANPPASSPESVERGRAVYEAQGCAACHGDTGRGNGLSAPTLQDDWEQHIRPADMTMPWTFRGGSTRKDIYRTFTTGLNGTPMPSYQESLDEQARWDLTNYVASLAEGGGEGGTDPDYANLLIVGYTDEELDPTDPEAALATATAVRFPLVGQIMEPGRNFYPSATSIVVQAVRNRRDILFRLRWNDMRAETAGTNGPALEVPLWDEQLAEAGISTDGGEPTGDDIWGDAVVEDEGGGDIWGDDAVAEDEGDFWGDEAAGDDDFWGDDAGGAAAVGGDYSDAVALQLPSTLPTGIAKPYFGFGDLERSVDLWFVDLAGGTRVDQFVGRGSQSLTPSEADEFEIVSGYDNGAWTVVIKRSLRSTDNVSFAEDGYVPVAFSVWDGFNEERGNKRALSAWMYLYVEPAEEVSPVGPMVKAALGTLVVELIAVFLLYRRFGPKGDKPAPVGNMVPQRG